jgi:NAD(P)-dependent dehydrogenase (short-subunit alcohol dehydrogenase family)
MSGLPDAPPPGTPMLGATALHDEVVLVTGGGTGLGLAMALEFARHGAAVAVASRSDDHRRDGVEAIRRAGGRGVGVELDVRDAEAVTRSYDQVERELGLVSILVNNAAGNFPTLATELSANGWRAVTQIVLDGTFFCSTEFARRRIVAGAGGSILNIAATYAWTGGPGTAASAAAKAGVVNLTQSLAIEWAPHGIRVNALAPGRFPHRKVLDQMRNEETDDGSTTVPAGRVGSPHELGYAAVWMCSPFAAYLTGHTLVVDGGNWLRRGLAMPEFTPVEEQLSRLRPQF